MAKPPESARRRGRRRRPQRTEIEGPPADFLELEGFDAGILGGGKLTIAGVDEAGRGALAGPVVAAAVVLPRGSGLIGVTDSKKLGEDERERLFSVIVEKAVAVGIAVGHCRLIDRKNILNATLITMRRAVGNLRIEPDIVLVDGRDRIDLRTPVMAVVGGDRKSLSIAAASIIAKVTRDRLMRRLHRKYPVYNFLNNKGYGTREHIDAIGRYGLASEHRRTYRPNIVEKERALF